jgi:hypothetical protein
MSSAGVELEFTIDEYNSTFTDIVQDQNNKHDLPWALIQNRLKYNNGWTKEGAGEIVRLVREYGGFMLRNALAIAKVLEIEDGELKY